MTYYNLIFKYGEERFVDDAVRQGLNGYCRTFLRKQENWRHFPGLDMIFLVAPTARMIGSGWSARSRASSVRSLTE
jgi:tryptophan synthase alpha subunit